MSGVAPIDFGHVPMLTSNRVRCSGKRAAVTVNGLLPNASVTNTILGVGANTKMSVPMTKIAVFRASVSITEAVRCLANSATVG